ncbi:hypothetical protein FIBSPDRAFT_927169 [Athelia psychrophila]|uniref:Uncharacterized protein n=1 Tax=Athelia psychrophila TaxID=1759441 RepID=A0A166S6R6_9AGAM|nr:hypothetical protein FIBSPDRAFT_927169 [Fibularhizoctonia sp. CBS 109695]
MSNPNLLNSSHQSYQSPSPSLRWFLSSYVSNARLPCPPPLRQHASPTDSNSLERGFINEKEGGVYTDNEELGHVYGDARTIDLDANGKGKPIQTGKDYALRVISLDDDPSLPIWTLRTCFLSFGLSCFAAVLGLLPSPGGYVSDLFLHIIASFLGRVVEYAIPGLSPTALFKTRDSRFWHASLTGPLSDVYYVVKPNIAVGIFTLIGSQLIEYGPVGMASRQFLVYPTWAICSSFPPTRCSMPRTMGKVSSCRKTSSCKHGSPSTSPTLTGISIFCLAGRKSAWSPVSSVGPRVKRVLGFPRFASIGTTSDLEEALSALLSVHPYCDAAVALRRLLGVHHRVLRVVCQEHPEYAEHAVRVAAPFLPERDRGLSYYAASYLLYKVSRTMYIGAATTHFFLSHFKNIWAVVKSARILGQLTKRSPCREADHFIIVYVDGNEVLRSDRTPREPPPHWKVQKGLRFDVSSTIKIVIYRRSLSLKRVPLKKNFVAEYSGLGSELLDKDIDHELVDMAGHKVGPSMSIQLDLEIESHIDFMKTVDEDVARLTTVKGADTADTVITIAGKLATVLQKIVPIVDDFASTHPVMKAAWVVLSSAYKVQLILGQLTKQSPCREADHFLIVYVDGNEILRSDRTPREPPPHWKVQKGLRFDLSSTIRIVVYRRSLSLKRVPLKKNFVAEYSGLGIELLDKDIDRALVDEAGHEVGSSMSIQLDLEVESHIDFMKTVDEDVARLTTVKGADTADTVITIAGKLATVLQKIVPIVDDFASTHPVMKAAWVVLSSAYKPKHDSVLDI